MKICVSILIVTGSLLTHLPSQAQWAVIDKANLTQALQQVSAWRKQYDQMVEQQNQLKQQYTAATGSRGLGSFASDPRLLATVPPDVQAIYDALQTKGSAGLTNAARELRNHAKIYDCDRMVGEELLNCQRLLNSLAQQQALLRSAMQMTSQRGTQVQTLQDKINATNDPKSIAELQARLQAEAIQVGNDANRLALMRSLAEANDRAAEQAVRETVLRSLSRLDNGSASFRYAPISH